MKVAIIMGSATDWGVMKSAVDTLKNFGVEFEVTVADDELAKKLIAYREQMAETIELKDKNLKKEFF